MTRVAFFSGSFDPPTNGHVDIMEQAAALYDKLVIGIGAHASKAGLFPVSERIALVDDAARKSVEARGAVFELVAFQGLAVDAARRAGASFIVRGLRDGTDFDYEMRMAGMNRALAPDIAMVFLPASAAARTITATLVRQIAAMGGDVSAFATPNVVAALRAEYAKR